MWLLLYPLFLNSTQKNFFLTFTPPLFLGPFRTCNLVLYPGKFSRLFFFFFLDCDHPDKCPLPHPNRCILLPFLTPTSPSIFLFPSAHPLGPRFFPPPPVTPCKLPPPFLPQPDFHYCESIFTLGFSPFLNILFFPPNKLGFSWNIDNFPGDLIVTFIKPFFKRFWTLMVSMAGFNTCALPTCPRT